MNILPMSISLAIAIASGVGMYHEKTKDPYQKRPKKITEKAIEKETDEAQKKALKVQKFEQESKRFGSVSLFLLNMVSTIIGATYLTNLLNTSVFSNNAIARSILNVLIPTLAAMPLRYFALKHSPTKYDENGLEVIEKSTARKLHYKEDQFRLALYQGVATVGKELVQNLLLYCSQLLFKGPLEKFASSSFANFIASTVAKSVGFAAFQLAHQLLYATTESYKHDQGQISGKKIAIASLGAFLLGTVSNIVLGTEFVKDLINKSPLGGAIQGFAQVGLALLYNYVLSLVTEINREDMAIALIN